MNDQEFLNFILKQGVIRNAHQHEWALDLIWSKFNTMQPRSKIDKLCTIVAEYEAVVFASEQERVDFLADLADRPN